MYKVSEELLKDIKALLSWIHIDNVIITPKLQKEADRISSILKDEYYVE